MLSSVVDEWSRGSTAPVDRSNSSLKVVHDVKRIAEKGFISTSNMGENKETQKTRELNSYVSINIDDGNHFLAADIINNIPAMRSSLSFIYRVPERLRVLNVKKFEPRILSVGPYHHKQQLRITERHKKWYLCDLISRSTPQDISFQDIVKAVRDIELEARKCYAETIDISSDDFVKMMILDGCFILELLYKYKEYKRKPKEESQAMHSSDKHDHDPIFSATWVVRTIQRDLVLLENQIPYIVMETLFELTRDFTYICSLNDLVLWFLGPALPTKLVQKNDKLTGKHLLDLLRNHLLSSSKAMKYGEFPTWNFTQHSATDLREVGVRIQKKEKATGLLDITFNSCGVLEIPPFFFGEGMTVLLPNIIAMEQCHRYYTDRITSYAILLDSLVNTKDDIKLLRTRGILDVMWNEDEKIACEINRMCKGVKIDEFYYDDLCRKVNAYCRTDWHRWRATLRRSYFNTPWAVISFFAAVLLLVMTFAQTLFSIHKI